MGFGKELGGAVLGGLLGGLAAPIGSAVGGTLEHLLGDSVEEAKHHAAAYLDGPPGNHDLERALHAAHLTGLLLVLRQHEIARLGDKAPKPGSLRDRYQRLSQGLATVLELDKPDPAALEIWHIRHYCHGELGRLHKLTEEPDRTTLTVLTESLSPAFAAAPVTGQPTDQRIGDAETMVWRALEKSKALVDRGVRLPPEFRARFFSRDPKAPGWFGCFMAVMQEALKQKDGRARTAFLWLQLAKLREEQGAVGKLIERGLAQQAERFDRVDRRLEVGFADVLAAIERKQGVPHATLAALLARMGEEGVAEGAIEGRLSAKADEYVALRAELERRTNDRPDAAAARAQALRLLEAGDFDGARKVLASGRGRLRESREQTAREEAQLAAEEARIAKLSLRYRDAAALYGEAAGLLAFDAEASWARTVDAADTLFDQGKEFGENAALRDAIAAYERALILAPRRDRPLDWATTQNNLGNALAVLGERGDDAALRRAVAAYEAALEERTRERVPLGWAMTQNNLGSALAVLGERGDDAALRRAVGAYEAALEEYTRERVPLDWAMTQNNLGAALEVLGERGDDAALRRAVAAYEAALEEYTRERVPLDWAMTQNNLGNALRVLGERGDDAALRRAVAAYEAALEVFTRERVPLGWATTQNNLGNALLRLGERGDDAALRRAVAAYEAALEERTRERVPLDWAGTQNNLGSALRVLGQRGDDAALRRAVAAHEAALEEYTRERVPYPWANTAENLAVAEEVLAGRLGEPDRLRRALVLAEGALEEYTRIGAAYDIGTATELRDRLRGKLGRG